MTKQTFKNFAELQSLLPADKQAELAEKKAKNANDAKQSLSKSQTPKAALKRRKNPKARTRKQIDPKLQAIFEALNWLQQTFPKAFFKPRQIEAALKIGINQDINNYVKENTVPHSLTLIRKALAMYTRGIEYLTISSQEGKQRVDLQGNAVESISSEHALYAQKKLQEQKAKRAQKQVATDVEHTPEQK